MSGASAGQRLIALLMELKVDVVFRLNQRRTADFGHGKRRGKGDHVVRWTRPPKPEWMDDETYKPVCMPLRHTSNPTPSTRPLAANLPET